MTMTEKQQENWDKGVEWKYLMSPRARIIIENNIKNLLTTREQEVRKALVRKEKSKFMLKKGTVVWAKFPMNAHIVSVNKKYGYKLKTDDGAVWRYFSDDEVTEQGSYQRRLRKVLVQD